MRSVMRFWAWQASRRRHRLNALRKWRTRGLCDAWPRWLVSTHGVRSRRGIAVQLWRKRAAKSLRRSIRRWTSFVAELKARAKELWLLRQLSEQVAEEITFSKRVMHRWELNQWRATDPLVSALAEPPSHHLRHSPHPAPLDSPFGSARLAVPTRSMRASIEEAQVSDPPTVRTSPMQMKLSSLNPFGAPIRSTPPRAPSTPVWWNDDATEAGSGAGLGELRFL